MVSLRGTTFHSDTCGSLAFLVSGCIFFFLLQLGSPCMMLTFICYMTLFLKFLSLFSSTRAFPLCVSISCAMFLCCLGHTENLSLFTHAPNTDLAEPVPVVIKEQHNCRSVFLYNHHIIVSEPVRNWLTASGKCKASVLMHSKLLECYRGKERQCKEVSIFKLKLFIDNPIPKI